MKIISSRFARIVILRFILAETAGFDPVTKKPQTNNCLKAKNLLPLFT
jgi:hypothetical protein